jgi:hypothetical protein
MRLLPTVSRRRLGLRLLPGFQFEARLRYRELEGPYKIEVAEDGSLKALKDDRSSYQVDILPRDIAPRYVTVPSPDFGTGFDVDMFTFCEDQLRNRATDIREESKGGPMHDPLLGTLATEIAPQLTSGADHLKVFAQFIHKMMRSSACPNQSRALTLFNLSLSNQGEASSVVDALVDFRAHHPTADICAIVSKLGPTEFQNSPAFMEFTETLSRNRIRIDTYQGAADGSIRQVMHGKGIVIDDQVLFSTGAVMDTKPINKYDFSIELPTTAANVFRIYVEEAFHGEATNERRAELAAELARLGVIINDPVAGLAYVSRAQDALIRGARYNLTLSLSELIDPVVTQMLIHRAAKGVEVMIQVRELDEISLRLLRSAMVKHTNLRLEDTSWWEPRPHFNVIIADGRAAYIGSSYLWSTQRNMLHHGRSFENGVLLCGEAAAEVYWMMDQLRTQAYSDNPVAIACNMLKSWSMQYTLYARDLSLHFSHFIAVKVLDLEYLFFFTFYYTSRNQELDMPCASRQRHFDKNQVRSGKSPARYDLWFKIRRCSQELSNLRRIFLLICINLPL